ncbi:MAG TPA: hypothetical protein VFE23_00400 [Usitatibacter sp.]|nr:hypothetical protein [Usitatibacter sp.]
MAAVSPIPGAPSAGIRPFAPARAARAKLRIGVFADRALQPRWIVEALARVAACEYAEIVAIVTEQNRGRSRNSPDETPAWLLRAYTRLDRRLFGGGTDWLAPSDVRRLVPAPRRFEVERAGAAMRESSLDVAFVLGDVDEEALDGVARFGTWRYCFGDEQDCNESLAGVRELLENRPTIASAIRIRRGAGQEDRIAHPSWSRAVAFSLARGHDGVFPKSAQFVARSLRDLHAQGAAWFENATEPAAQARADRSARGPSLVRDLLRVGGRVAQRTVEHLTTVGQWTLAYRFVNDEPWTGSLEGFVRLAPPKDRFWADPFPLEHHGRHYIYFEELPFAAHRAHISVMEVKRDGTHSEPVRVLERDYHLSYPFLLQEGGELYMIPETAHNRAIELYRCVRFPDKWKFERTLVPDVWCADATIHRAGDRLWMFATQGQEGSEINDELHIFTADHLLGEWKPHRRNPVKSDVRNARPAGRLFLQHGDLIRPAQICTPLYGSGIALNRVTRLDDLEYREEEVRRIVPAGRDGILGLHTINRAGALSVTDAFLRRSRFGA